MKGLCSVTSINTQAAFAGEMECCSIMIDQWCVGVLKTLLESILQGDFVNRLVANGS